jgi:hypothetical protein
MHDADFTPLRPRRWKAVEEPCTSEERTERIEDQAVPCPPTPPVVDEPVDVPTDSTFALVSAEPPEQVPDVVVLEDDEEERAAALREEAIRFASIALARALRVTLAENAAALSRYVDDALSACGRVERARVRLHPSDAACYRPRRDVEIIADASQARGDVVVETDVGMVCATLEERAALLARAAAHA